MHQRAATSTGLHRRKNTGSAASKKTSLAHEVTTTSSVSPSKLGSNQRPLKPPSPQYHQLDNRIVAYLFEKDDGTMADFVTIAVRIFGISILVASTLTFLGAWCTTSPLFDTFYMTTLVGNTISSFRVSIFPVQQVGAIKDGKYKLVPLQPSSIYSIPDAMDHIGDKSDNYATLRKEYDAMDLSAPVQQKLQFTSKPMNTPGNDQQVPYDIYNCPDNPPHGYPYAWTLTDIITHWPANDTIPRLELYQGLCVFDHQSDYVKALKYRTAELPFVVRNDPQVLQSAARWTSPGYMSKLLGTARHRVEYSENSHFMYWTKPSKRRKNDRAGGSQQSVEEKDGGEEKSSSTTTNLPNTIIAPEGWKEPTKSLRMTYDEWVTHANVTDPTKLNPDHPHWYFRFIACGEIGPQGQCDLGSSEFTFDELPFFQPKKSLYIVNPHDQKGINCRFGMGGVIAENHFDGSRNAIALLGGERRYILSHPDQCRYLALHPKGHPSARHSAVDWTNPTDWNEFHPSFTHAQGNEVVLQAGEVLYLPTNWFHFIVSLSLNFQCNTRSGISKEYMPALESCGF